MNFRKNMEKFLNAVDTAIKNQNWYAALFMSLTFPDICGKLENPESNNSSKRYIDWFNKYMTQYNGYLSGMDCYLLRCAVLHEGNNDISEKTKKDVLDHFIFLESGGHCNVFNSCSSEESKKESFLRLNTQKFCEDICEGVKKWKDDINNNIDIIERINQMIKIQKPGYVYMGIQFC